MPAIQHHQDWICEAIARFLTSIHGADEILSALDPAQPQAGIVVKGFLTFSQAFTVQLRPFSTGSSSGFEQKLQSGVSSPSHGRSL